MALGCALGGNIRKRKRGLKTYGSSASSSLFACRCASWGAESEKSGEGSRMRCWGLVRFLIIELRSKSTRARFARILPRSGPGSVNPHSHLRFLLCVCTRSPFGEREVIHTSKPSIYDLSKSPTGRRCFTQENPNSPNARYRANNKLSQPFVLSNWHGPAPS